MNNLGATYYDQHDLDLALSYNEQSLTIREKRKDPVELASSVLNIGVVYEAMGNTAKASGHFERALQLTTLPDLTPIRVRALYNFGNLLLRSKRITAAKEKLEEAINEIEAQLFRLGVSEVPSTTIGELVMQKLKELDEVAYIRFASVYRSFRDIESFREELATLLAK